MKKQLLTILLAVILCLTMTAAWAEPVTLTVLGTAAVTTEPDAVNISVNASVTRKDAMTAQEEISTIVIRMREALVALGLLEDDIVTDSYGFYPAYNYDSGSQKLEGYQATHAMTVTCRDLTKLNDVLTAITQSGVTEVYNIYYTSSQRSVLYRQALTDAVQAAREKADEMAKSCGFGQATMVSVTEKSIAADVLYANAARSEGMVEKVMDANINAGVINVTASVEVVFSAE